MQIQITSTEKITDAGGVPCRVWNGVHEDENQEEFERELKAQLPPASTTRFVDLRKVLS